MSGYGFTDRAALVPPSHRKRNVVLRAMRTSRRKAPRESVPTVATRRQLEPERRSIVTDVAPPGRTWPQSRATPRFARSAQNGARNTANDG